MDDIEACDETVDRIMCCDYSQKLLRNQTKIFLGRVAPVVETT